MYILYAPVFYGYKKLPGTPVDEECAMSREDRLTLAEYIIHLAKEANRLKELGRDEMLVSENLTDLLKAGKEDILMEQNMSVFYRICRNNYTIFFKHCGIIYSFNFQTSTGKFII